MNVQSREDFNKWIHGFGIISSLILFVGMTAFPVVASAVYGLWPDFRALWPGFIEALRAAR